MCTMAAKKTVQLFSFEHYINEPEWTTSLGCTGGVVKVLKNGVEVFTCSDNEFRKIHSGGPQTEDDGLTTDPGWTPCGHNSLMVAVLAVTASVNLTQYGAA